MALSPFLAQTLMLPAKTLSAPIVLPYMWALNFKYAPLPIVIGTVVLRIALSPDLTGEDVSMNKYFDPSLALLGPVSFDGVLPLICCHLIFALALDHNPHHGSA